MDQPALARRALDAALARAESLAHPHSLAYARTYGTYVLILLGEDTSARALLDGAMEVAEANALSHYADALEWKYIDEIPVQEIAARLGLGAKAAESLLTRARHAFRDAFRTLGAFPAS